MTEGSMDLLQNPFHILTATPRDNRRRISDLADERGLLLNSSECSQACSDLTNPRKRLSAEVAWLPKLSPKNAERIVTWLSKPVQAIPPSTTLDAPSPMARANIFASGLQKLARYNSNNVAQWVLPLARAFEDINPEELCAIINEERIVSGFSEVTDLSEVEAEIQERRRHYGQAIKSALDNLSPRELVKAVTEVVESATDDGKVQGPILIDDMVDLYEVEALTFLEKEEENIKALIEKLNTAADVERPDSTLVPMVNQLSQVVRNWDTVAQPIQVSTKSRGLGHAASYRIAGLVRELAIHFFNEHGKLDFSKQLTNMLQEVFEEVSEVAEQTAGDTNALNEIADQRVRLVEDEKTQAETWRKEVTYEADIGVLFKDKLRISPEGIEWKKRKWDLDSITRVRWGGIRHSLNGIPTGTIYSVTFGNGSKYTSIKLKNKAIYTNFIDRLWRSVGARLLTEYLEGLRDGKKYEFGSTTTSDYGIELEPNTWITRKKVFCRWNELTIWNGPGVFCVKKKREEKLFVELSYQDEDNVHVLEAAIRALWKRGGDRLSNLLVE
jgi:hypothetical protein